MSAIEKTSESFLSAAVAAAFSSFQFLTIFTWMRTLVFRYLMLTDNNRSIVKTHDKQFAISIAQTTVKFSQVLRCMIFRFLFSSSSRQHLAAVLSVSPLAVIEERHETARRELR